ncbi:MAG TPA: CheR family methyltransferase [Ktedonobacterales bacterium]|nr:CheR family methyltransferase [Ktedonobacterales bacterium]
MAKTEGDSSDQTGDQTARPMLDALVVVGSSAGGIEALSTLVASLPAGFPAPIILAQHLDPRHPSHLHEILARHAALEVRRVALDPANLEPGVIYVVPANHHVQVTDHTVQLLQQAESKGPKPSIDLLLSSAAEVFADRLIAVILTGSGSDGASGAHAVKAAGGTVVIENPATAAFPSMPASLAPTTIDIVADLDRVGPLLSDLLRGGATKETPEVDRSLQTLLDDVRDHSGIDFTHYKRPTIERRLQRRFHATGQTNVRDYLHYLHLHPEEYNRLVSTFLIKVTEFFRDTDLFTALQKQVVPDLIAQARERGNELRIWSAGCATGEEAYSLAMLVAEALGDELERFNVQIFATDLDEEAIAFARRGVYPHASLASLPPDLLARYFVKLDGAHQVTKLLRRPIIFGQHDLGHRPPFPHMDLVVCRNVLIYFTPELQRRALQLFAFALRNGGYLALGKAETIKPIEPAFTPAHRALKLYRRVGERTFAPITPISDIRASVRDVRSQPVSQGGQESAFDTTQTTQAWPPLTPPSQAQMVPQRTRTNSERLGELILDLPAGVAVVDRNYDVQFINRSALRLLGIYKAAIGNDLIHLTTSIATPAMRSAIDTALQLQAPYQEGDETTVVIEMLPPERRSLQIACYPVSSETDAAGEAPGAQTELRATGASSVLLVISDVTRIVQAPEPHRDAAPTADMVDTAQTASWQTPDDLAAAYQEAVAENARLKTQLDHLGAQHRALIQANEGLGNDNLALRSANEELLVSHEEAEATAEEVRTLNEELQSTNEELVTLNEELEATVEELHAANEDLQARTSELTEVATSESGLRKIAEAARASLEVIIGSFADAALIVDTAGAILHATTGYWRLFGDPTTQLVVQDMERHVLKREMSPVPRAARGERFTMNIILPTKEGVQRQFEVDGRPLYNEYGSGIGGVVILREITMPPPSQKS